MSRHNRQLHRRHRLAAFTPRAIAEVTTEVLVQATTKSTKIAKLLVREAIAVTSHSKRASQLASVMRGMSPPAPGECFIIEQHTAEGWVPIGKHSAKHAKDLSQAAGEYAKAQPGLKVRIIKPLPGARAASRFCWQQDTVTGHWFLGSYR